MNIKVFISQGMIDRDDEEVFEERDHAVRLLQKCLKKSSDEDIEIEVLDSFVEEDPPEDCKHYGVWYMSHSLSFLAQADLAIFLPKWNRYRGCRIEHLTAERYSVPFITFNDDWSVQGGYGSLFAKIKCSKF